MQAIATSQNHQGRYTSSTKQAQTPLSPAMAFLRKIHGTTAIAIDNSAMMQAALKGNTGLRLDPEGVLMHLSGDSLLWAKMAVTLPPNPRPSQIGFYNYCSRLGIEVKHFAPLVDGYGRVSEHEYFVDGCVRDAIIAAAEDPDCDSIVIMGADGGFARAAKYARRQGKSVFVVAWHGTLHKALAESATANITFEELRHFVGRAVQ